MAFEQAVFSKTALSGILGRIASILSLSVRGGPIRPGIPSPRSPPSPARLAHARLPRRADLRHPLVALGIVFVAFNRLVPKPGDLQITAGDLDVAGARSSPLQHSRPGGRCPADADDFCSPSMSWSGRRRQGQRARHRARLRPRHRRSPAGGRMRSSSSAPRRCRRPATARLPATVRSATNAASRRSSRPPRTELPLRHSQARAHSHRQLHR